MTPSNYAQKTLAVEIIFQDMRYHQLIFGLEALGLVNEHYLDLCTIAGRLQGIPEGRISDTWMRMYLKFMEEARNLPMDNKKALYALAGKCYEHLSACCTVEAMMENE